MSGASGTSRCVHGRVVLLTLLAAAGARATPTGAQNEQRPISLLLEEEFRGGTETREQRPERQHLTERAEHVLSDFIDIGGYLRSGYGRSGAGGPMIGFQAPGAASKYRLGNEAETYGELSFGKNLYLPGTFELDGTDSAPAALAGPVAHVQARVSFFNPYNSFGSADATAVGLPEAWASVGQVLHFAPTTKFWAGNRFYRRHDIHVTDFYYWNTSGGGGGIEDVPLGPGRIAFAWIGWGSTSGLSYVPQPDPENRAGFSKSTYDLRAYDLPLLFGHVELGLAYANAVSGVDQSGRKGPRSHGFAGTLVHTIQGFISEDGVQKLSIQYGTGPARTFTAGFETVSLPQGSFIKPEANDYARVRVTESFTANVGEHFSVGPVAIFQLSREGSPGDDQLWVSAGARPIVHFTRHVSLAVEGGLDWVKDEAAATEGALAKLTVAPQISIDNRWSSRPVVRAFVTGAFWTDDFVGEVGGVDYATQNEGLNAGVQMEAWW
ncbi:MAG TPA: carbohydrate porin [Polyangiaceae bacterium]